MLAIVLASQQKRNQMIDAGSTEAESQGDKAMPTQGSRDQRVD
jgi:hypothetical protein